MAHQRRMTLRDSRARRARTAAVAALLLASGCTPSAFRADAGAAFMRVNGDIGLQNSMGGLVLHDNMNDVRSDLQAGETKASPYLRFEADWGPHRAKLSGFGHNSSGDGTLSGDFGDIPAGTPVESDLDFIDVTGSWSYDLLPDDDVRLAPGVQIAFYSLDVSARATSISAFENVDTSVLAPMPYIDAGIDFGYVSLQANFGVIAADLGDADGRYWDAEALVRLQPSEDFEFIGGFRYLLIDAHGRASSRDFDADLDVYGWFLGGGVRF